MKYSKNLILFVLLFSAFASFGQSNEPVEMADILRQDGKIYTVVFGVVIILTAMIILLVRVDRKILRIEKELKKNKGNVPSTVLESTARNGVVYYRSRMRKIELNPDIDLEVFIYKDN